MKRKHFERAFLRLEALEARVVPSTFLGTDDSAHGEDAPHAIIVAGDPSYAIAPDSPDSPANRVDANTTSSPFAGVGSLQVVTRRGTYICTATAISPTHILTAGHCLDINNDGKSDRKDGILRVTFILNYGGNQTHKIDAASWTLHPEFTGFARPSINDDIAVIKLKSPLPAGIPIYAYDGTLASQETLYLVGYGQSGDGVNGYYVSPSFSVKRLGNNIADTLYSQDDANKPLRNEAFRFDFDAPYGDIPVNAGGSLGNQFETTLGGGDSGGSSFVLKDGKYHIAGVNTFVQSGSAQYPRFGSFGGGIIVAAYKSWIDGILGLASNTSMDISPPLLSTGSPVSFLLPALQSLSEGNTVLVLEFLSNHPADSLWVVDNMGRPSHQPELELPLMEEPLEQDSIAVPLETAKPDLKTKDRFFATEELSPWRESFAKTEW